VIRIRLLPLDLEKTGNCERLRLRPYLVPTTPKKKEQTFTNLGAVGQ